MQMICWQLVRALNNPFSALINMHYHDHHSSKLDLHIFRTFGAGGGGRVSARGKEHKQLINADRLTLQCRIIWRGAHVILP